MIYMSDYIKREDALHELRYWKHLEAYDHIRDMDGIELIECCDCRYFSEPDPPYGRMYCTRLREKELTEWDGWCFRAVRR
jgi:hypothetical protein